MERLPRLHRLDPQRRFRDRVLAALLVLAIAPLAAFVVIVAVELGGVSQSTVDQAHQAILQDQEVREQAQVARPALDLDVRLAAISGAVSKVRDAAAAAIARQPAQAAALSWPAAGHGGAVYSSSADSATTVIVGASSRMLQPGPSDQAARAVAADASLVPAMHGTLSDPAIDAVWVANRADQFIRTVPAIDAPKAIDTGRLSAQLPLGKGGDSVFSTSQASHMLVGAQLSQAWSSPDRPGLHRPANAFWTDSYLTLQSGQQGVTVWIAVDDDTTVGADINIDRLTQALLPPSVSGERDSYPLLLSSTNRILAADAGGRASRDFRLPQQWAGMPLPAGRDQAFASALRQVEATGRVQPLRTTIAGADRELFTAPVYTSRWVLVNSVPVADLEPDVAGLSRGIQAGIHGILIALIPLAVALCALALLLATLLSRRLVAPVRALTVAAERLAEGHTDEAVPQQGEDEVGQLSQSLERMRREINASRDAILAAARQLEQRVADRTAELRSRNEELVALNELAGSLTRSLDPSTLLEGAVRAVRAVLPVVAAAGYVLDDGIPRLAANAGATDVVDLADQLAAAAAAAVGAHDLLVRDTPTGTLVGLPLETSEGALGALAAVTPRSAAIDDRTRGLLRAVADQVGLALRTAQLSDEGRELAVLAERTRLAREIHDTLAQQLTAIVIQLEAAEAFVERDQGRAGSVVVAARDLARSALQEARRSVWNLRPAPLEETGLVAALTHEAQRWQGRTGIATTVRTQPSRSPLALRPQAEVALFRIVQEALNNVAHHSGARRVEVSIEERDGWLEVTVGDDGQGFDPASSRPDRFGLVGMSERARLAGAELEVESRLGGGTRVTARMRLAEPVAVA